MPRNPLTVKQPLETPEMIPILAQMNPGNLSGTWILAIGVVVAILGLIVLLVAFNFLGTLIRAYLAGARIGLVDLIRMRLLGIDYKLVVNQKIALVNAGVKVETKDLETHLLSRGNLQRTSAAVVAAKKASLDLPWSIAAAIDLAGRDVYEAVKRSVDPKVIDCPDPGKGRATLDGVCKNGIQLRARARVTVRTKLSSLVGGATEETIIARVGEGIVKAIGSAEHHTDVLANPNLISQAVLKNSLDAQTMYEIVSIDVAEIDVGANVGANLQADQAAANLRLAQADAEKRRAMAVAEAQENSAKVEAMRAKVEESRAMVVLAEADVPKAIAQAIREGKMGVMDYYNLQNLQADTTMRGSIAGVGNRPAQGPSDRVERP
jgi:uncharacterized protein YqfA (UPF0365 family)